MFHTFTLRCCSFLVY